MPRPSPILLLTFLASLACGSGQPPQAEAPPPAPTPAPIDRAALEAAVDGLAAAALANGPIAGASVAIAHEGRVVLAKGYGLADREAAVPAAPQTSYPIASISKQFTAAAVMRLAEKGLLSLDDELTRFVPAAAPGVTVRHLLNHTAGLVSRRGPVSAGATERFLRRARPAFPPGTGWAYSNAGYAILGLVVERASGRLYADYVREELATPLGLTGTAYCEDGAPVPQRSADYDVVKGALVRSRYWSTPRFFAAGGLCSTALDLLAWQKALDEGKVLSVASVAAMRKATRLADGTEAEYGLGVRIGRTGPHEKLGHTGGGRSNRAVLAHHPRQRTTIVVLVNTERTDAEVVATDLETAIARALWRRPEPAASPVPLAAAEIAQYAGDYVEGTRPVRIVARNGALRFATAGHPRAGTPLLAQGGDLFVDGSEPAVGWRFAVSGGHALSYSRYYNGWFISLGRRVSGRVKPPS